MRRPRRAARCCPMSGVEMSKADLVEVKSSATASVVKPRVAEATSIPRCSACFKTRGAVVSKCTLKESRRGAKGACAASVPMRRCVRVIARLKKSATRRCKPSRQRGKAVPLVLLLPLHLLPLLLLLRQRRRRVRRFLPAADLEKIEAEAKKLSKARRLPVPSDLSTPATIKEWKETHEHKPKSGCPRGGVHPVNSDLIALGNDTGSVSVYNAHRRAWRCAARVTQGCHRGPLSPLRPSVLISGSQDCTAKVWNSDACVHAIRHEMDVTGVDVQATGDYVCTSSLRGDWKMSARKRIHAFVRARRSGRSIHLPRVPPRRTGCGYRRVIGRFAPLRH